VPFPGEHACPRLTERDVGMAHQTFGVVQIFSDLAAQAPAQGALTVSGDRGEPRGDPQRPEPSAETILVDTDPPRDVTT